MIRKSLFALAVITLMVATVQAGDSATNPLKIDTDWPTTVVVTVNELELCQIPVKLKVGYFVEMLDCGKTEILLEQVPCTSIGKDIVKDFPCYSKCVNVKIRANFDVKLGTKLYVIGTVIDGSATPDPADDKWAATVTPDKVLKGGAWNTIALCVNAWNADIFYADPKTNVTVGEVAITVKPYPV